MLALIVSLLLASPEAARIQAPPDQALMFGPGGKIVLGPKWRSRPTREQFVAATQGVTPVVGVTEYTVNLICVAQADGSLTLCDTVEERPAGLGVAAAALSLAERYAIASTLPDGAGVAGRVIVIPIGFRFRPAP